MKTRAFITMTLAVDLDMVPGFGHRATDWPDFIRHQLGGADHYHPVLDVTRIEERPYVWNGEAYEPPSIDQKDTSCS